MQASAELSLQAHLAKLAGYNPASVPVTQAKQIISSFLYSVNATEKLSIRQSLGRILAQDIISGIHVPAHDNSAMDGYAFNGAELQNSLNTPQTLAKLTSVNAEPLLRFEVIGNALAGSPFQGSPASGQCVRIMTGAVMPAGTDTVIPQELIAKLVPAVLDQTHHDCIEINPEIISRGDNRRLAGEDLARGSVALTRGKCIQAADLGLLASLGVSEVAVFRKLRVAFFSTGDELRSLGEPLDAACVYDSNRYTIYAMLQKLGCELLDMGVIPDDPEQLESALRSACENADAIITSGGVSVGSHDFTKQVMAQLGDMAFWTIAMRPGRPMAFGKIHSNGKSAFLFGLPGNPVAVMVTFYFLVQDALLEMMGAQIKPRLLVAAKSVAAIRKRAGRTEYQRGIAKMSSNGQLEVAIAGAQGSGILSSMSAANCMVVLSDQQNNIAAGDTVQIILFEGLI